MKYIKLHKSKLNEDFIDTYDEYENNDEEDIKTLAKDAHTIYTVNYSMSFVDFLIKYRYLYASLFEGHGAICYDSLFNSGNCEMLIRNLYSFQNYDKSIKMDEYLAFIDKRRSKIFVNMKSIAKNMFERTVLGRCNKMIYGIFNYYINLLTEIILKNTEKTLDEIQPQVEVEMKSFSMFSGNYLDKDSPFSTKLKYSIEMLQRAGIENETTLSSFADVSAIANQLAEFLVGIVKNAPKEFKTILEQNREKVKRNPNPKYLFTDEAINQVTTNYYRFFEKFIEDFKKLDAFNEVKIDMTIPKEDDFISEIMKNKPDNSDLTTQELATKFSDKFTKKMIKTFLIPKIINELKEFSTVKYYLKCNNWPYSSPNIHRFKNKIKSEYNSIKEREKILVKFYNELLMIFKIGLLTIYTASKNFNKDKKNDEIFYNQLGASCYEKMGEYFFSCESLPINLNTMQQLQTEIQFTIPNINSAKFENLNAKDCTKEYFDKLLKDNSLNKYVKYIDKNIIDYKI